MSLYSITILIEADSKEEAIEKRHTGEVHSVGIMHSHPDLIRAVPPLVSKIIRNSKPCCGGKILTQNTEKTNLPTE